jgi:hypothetical protein
MDFSRFFTMGVELSTCIMKTARISDLRRAPLTAGFVPLLWVGSFLRSESAGCTIATIERPSPDRLWPVLICLCTPRELWFVPSRVFLPYRGDNRIQAYSTNNRSVLVLG